MPRQATPDIFKDALAVSKAIEDDVRLIMGEPGQGGAPVDVDLDLIDDNPYQPRLTYDEAALQELADSIAANGLVQPVSGRRKADGRYELEQGHRRLRAYRLLRAKGEGEYQRIPMFVRTVADFDLAMRAWAENHDREGITAIEEAQWIQRMMTDFDLSQAVMAKRLGKSAATVANKLRLLRAPEEVRNAVATGEISERQAAALMPVFDLPAPTQAKMHRDGFYSSAAMLQAARDGKSSGELRQRADQIILQTTKRLEGVPFFDHDFGDGDWQARRCTDCTQRIRRLEKDLCPIAACYDAKSSAWESQQIADAVKATGLQALPREVDYTEKTTFNYYSDSEREHVQRIYGQGCPNLRMKQSAHMRWSPPGTHDIELVCYHPGKTRCSCMMARKRAMTKDTRAQRKDLDQQAEPMLLEVLARGDLAVLRLVARHFKSDDAVQEWDAETCTKAILPFLVKSVMPWEPDKDPAGVQKGWEKLLATAGVRPPWEQAVTASAVELDDDGELDDDAPYYAKRERVSFGALSGNNGYIEPTVDRESAEYIGAKLDRIRAWLEYTRELAGGGIATIPEAFQGNLANLARLSQAIEKLENQQDRARLRTIANLLTNELEQIKPK